MITRYRIEILALGYERRKFLYIQERAIELKIVLVDNEDQAYLFLTEDVAMNVVRMFTRMDYFARVAPVYTEQTL